MKRFIGFLYSFCCLLLVFFAASGIAQTVAHNGVQTVLVLPFENRSKAPGLDWIGEAFPEVLGQRLTAAHLNLISRDDRNYAFDRLGIPTTLHPSRATLFRIAEQMDADFVVFGSYNYDGQTFSTSAQVLDMKRLKLSDELKNNGPLLNLIDVQTNLSWRVLKSIVPETQGTGEQFMRSSEPIRLDAFENFIRGVVATEKQDRIKHFREALRLNPQYTDAVLALGKTYFTNREYESAAGWFARVPRTSVSFGEANFLLGLSDYYTGDFDKAEAAFREVEQRLPLTEVYNNLGVVAIRRRKNSVDYFQKAVQQDPNDPDYRFNLGIALYRTGDTAGAVRQLREAVARRPADSEAKDLLNTISGVASANMSQTASGTTPTAAHLPAERIKRNYDENSYRQLAMEVRNAMEQTLSNTDPKTHAEFHVEHGIEMLSKGLVGDAEVDFREAILLDPTNARAHAGLAQVAELNGDIAGARHEAQTSLQLQQTADAYLVLGRLDLKDNRIDAAEQNADRALALDPASNAAAALKRDVGARKK